MLAPRQDWRRYTGGAIALELLNGIHQEAQRVQFARLLIRASLDLAVMTFFGKRDPEVIVHEMSADLWSIKGLRYLFLPEMNDDALNKCRNELPKPQCAIVIVPSRCDNLFRNALETLLNGAVPNVQNFVDFISWRTSFASLDADWSRERVLSYLYDRYNFHAMAAGADPSIIFRIPPSLT
jgi:hypothetical protein